MASLFVDTNVFLRFLTNDDLAKAKRAETLFRDALRGKIRLATSQLVIAEIIWTLESFYKLEKSDIAAKVEKILNRPNLHCPEAPLLFMALDLYVHANIDFVDAYNAFHMKEHGLTQILTYDRKHFARIPWVHIGDLCSHNSQFLDGMNTIARFPSCVVGGNASVSCRGEQRTRIADKGDRRNELRQRLGLFHHQLPVPCIGPGQQGPGPTLRVRAFAHQHLFE